MSAEKEAFAIDPEGWVHLTPFAVSAVWSVISKLRNKGEVKNG